MKSWNQNNPRYRRPQRLRRNRRTAAKGPGIWSRLVLKCSGIWQDWVYRFKRKPPVLRRPSPRDFHKKPRDEEPIFDARLSFPDPSPGPRWDWGERAPAEMERVNPVPDPAVSSAIPVADSEPETGPNPPSFPSDRDVSRPAADRIKSEGAPAARRPATGRRAWPILLGLTLLLAAGGVFWYIRSQPALEETPHEATARSETLPAEEVPPAEEWRPPLPAGAYELYQEGLQSLPVTEVTIEAGSTLSQALETLGLPIRSLGGLVLEALTKSETVQIIRPGALIRAFWADESHTELKRLEYHPSIEERPILVLPDGSGSFWTLEQKIAPVTIQRGLEGQVDSTFWEAGEKAGLDPSLIMSFADLLASEVDFFSDLQKGDTFQILFQRDYRDSLPQGPPLINMIRLTSGGRDIEFHRYVDAAGQAGYYDPNGRSNIKAFLISPLQYTRISSGYSLNRMHPIYKSVRPHQGVDYAAPTGTPVSAVADGLVVFAGWNGGYGQLVTIEHDKTYTTMYAHLSRIAKGVTKGSRVSQGELIGHVGATGTATGPHLDYRMKRNGTFIDPQPEMAKQQGKSLNPADAQRFTQTVTGNRNSLAAFLAARED